jgi:single-strand DNA-binding protein
MNYGTFAGRLGADAVIRSTPNGKDVTGYSLAVNVGFGDKKETLWVGCSQWGERGKKLAPYLTKGTSVVVTGEVGLRQYTDKAGKPRAELTCNVQGITLMGGGDKAEKPAQTAHVSEDLLADDPSDSIPF